MTQGCMAATCLGNPEKPQPEWELLGLRGLHLSIRRQALAQMDLRIWKPPH